jgi:hypothetical protein
METVFHYAQRIAFAKSYAADEIALPENLGVLPVEPNTTDNILFIIGELRTALVIAAEEKIPYATRLIFKNIIHLALQDPVMVDPEIVDDIRRIKFLDELYSAIDKVA